MFVRLDDVVVPADVGQQLVVAHQSPSDEEYDGHGPDDDGHEDRFGPVVVDLPAEEQPEAGQEYTEDGGFSLRHAQQFQHCNLRGWRM